MEVKYTALSEIGNVRAHNEDCYGIAENTPNGSIYVVCDGMGGHVGGATASRLAVNSILEYFKKEKYDNLILELERAFQFANEQIFAHTLSAPELKGMGTTAVVLIIKKEECYIGHVGDSRIYIKSDKKLHRLTKDHSYVQGLVDAGVITDEDAEKHPQKNQILKALGHTSEVKGKICKKPFRVKAGDTFLLCTDGLNGMINDAVIEGMMNGNDLEKSQQDLFEAAMANGGLDNVTILLVQITHSKFYGRNEFKSYNPIERGRGQEDNFDKTSGFSKTQQLDNSQRPTQKKKTWIPYLLYVSVGTLVLTLSLFLIFRPKEQTPPPTDNQTDNVSNIQDQRPNRDTLQLKTFAELEKMASQSTLLSEELSNKEEIYTNDGKTAILEIEDGKLIGVRKKENKPIADPPPPPVTDPQKNTTTKTNATIKKPPCFSGSKSDQFEGTIRKGEYYVEIANGGEKLKDLISRIQKNPEYGCNIPKELQEPEKLAAFNKRGNKKVSAEIIKLFDKEDKYPGGTKILIKCDCDQ